MIKILSVVDAVSKLVGAFSALLTVSIAVVILSEVAARSLFNYSFSFAWEYSAYAMGVAMFGGAAYTLRTGGHIRVSLLASSMPKKAARWVDILCTFLGLFFVGFIAKALIEMAWRSYLSGSTSPTISETPLIIPQGLIAFGAALLTVQMLARLIRLFINEEPEDISVSFQVE